MAATVEMDGRQALKVLLGLVRLFGELAVLVAILLCAAFTFVASGTLLAYFLISPGALDGMFLLKLGIKMTVFGGLSVLLVLRLRWLYPYLRRMPYPDKTLLKKPENRATSFLIIVLVFAAGLALVHLNDYPRAEPDEMHHLIVAKNLAMHGEYASGRPETGLVRFDSYDSVGATVIVPVAGALRVAGIDLLPARMVMVAFYVALLLVVYVLLLPVFDGRGAVLGVVFVSGALGTLYLARTVYGEIPALLFLSCGLLCWRRGIQGTGVNGWLVAGGIFFGLAVVTKMFMIFALWAFLAAYLYDRLTFRRVRLLHMAIPAMSAALIVGIWWGIQSRYQTVVEGVASGQLAVYQHNLMFGLDSVSHTLGWLFSHGAIVLVSTLCFCVAGMWVFYWRYDPAVVVFWMFAVFIGYWWVFFTTGNIPRYVWYALAISASFVGPMSGIALMGAMKKRNGRWRVRPLRLLLATCLCIPFAMNLSHEFTSATAHDDMSDDRMLSEYVKSLPLTTEVATTFYPVERMLSFFADRYVTRIPATKEAVQGHALVIVDAESQRALVDTLGTSRRIGRYAVYERMIERPAIPGR